MGNTLNKDKQIEEMANDYYEAMLKARETLGSMNEGAPKWYAKEIYTKGYRKSTELAEEIFAEIREELVRYLMLNENIAIKCKDENGEWNAEYWKGKLSAFKQIQGFINTELKKKYESEKDNA